MHKYTLKRIGKTPTYSDSKGTVRATSEHEARTLMMGHVLNANDFQATQNKENGLMEDSNISSDGTEWLDSKKTSCEKQKPKIVKPKVLRVKRKYPKYDFDPQIDHTG